MKGVYAVETRRIVRCKYCRAIWPDIYEFLRDDTGLAQAAERGELALDFQPIVDLAGGRVVGAEALVRWRHPRGGRLTAEEFLPLAETTGAVASLGAWALRAACEQGAVWERSPAPLFVCVNVSAGQLGPSFPGVVRRALEESGLAPGLLWVEITKSGTLEHLPVLRDSLVALRDIGVRVGLDNVGTGTATLVDLKDLPLDVVKIDRSIIQDLGSNPVASFIVDSMVTMARAMGWSLVVTGVETARQRDEATRLGCLLAQGHYWAPGVPGEMFEATAPA